MASGFDPVSITNEETDMETNVTGPRLQSSLSPQEGGSPQASGSKPGSFLYSCLDSWEARRGHNSERAPHFLARDLDGW